jgi:hypothetical protein
MAAPPSGLTTLEFCPSCRHRVYEIRDPTRIIDPPHWDGSDLFIVWPLPNFRFCSDRLASILRQNQITGVNLIPASQIPMRPLSKLTPGPLTAVMPEARAREIARQFDVL